jgi:hypothetical protein
MQTARRDPGDGGRAVAAEPAGGHRREPELGDLAAPLG